MKAEELGLNCEDEDSDSLKYYSIVCEIKQRMIKDNEIDDQAKEKIIDGLYEKEGFYSVNKSYNNIFGGLMRNRAKIANLYYTIILCLMMFMFLSIYLALYNYFINKTLVVNIFLQMDRK